MNNKGSNEGKKNIFFVCMILVLMFSITATTYAYFALSASNSTAMTGTAGTASLSLGVSRITPSSNNGALVPQLESALGSAVSSRYNCVDDNSNVVCHIYKIEVKNVGTSTVKVKGTVTFTNSSVPNLKYRMMTDATTLSDEVSKYALDGKKLIFVDDVSLEKNETAIYYMAVWIDETGEAQTDSGTYRATVEFDSADGEGLTSTMISTFSEEVMQVNAVSDENIDFSVPSSTSGTNGIYLRSGTENNANPIYYYRGNVNNNMIFADTCWKIVRTTETGGLKLIYNGVPTDGTCNNTGEASLIGTKAFNENSDSPAYVGYMYGTPYKYSRKSMSSDTTAYVYGNDVTYSNGIYTLTNTITSADWSSIYNGGLNNNHYTCFTTGTTCSSVYYVYYTNSSISDYITLKDGKKIEDALSEMLDYNTTSSTIKGDKDTSGTLDYWYYNNIELAGYSDYIEDTVWCNDRSIGTLNGLDPNGGSTTDYLYVAARNRVYSTYEPSLSCSREIDSFTVDEKNGNGDLDYPVGLLTADEIMLAGVMEGTWNSTYYLYSGSNYWAGSPYYFASGNAREFSVFATGALNCVNVGGYNNGVRPSLSLKRGFKLIGDGDGSVSNPYVVE